MSIKYNGKDIVPKINGVNLSRVMYNGKQIYPNVNNNVIEIQLADTVAGDVCAFDGTNKRFFRFVDSGATDDIKKYTPIGVVVIPTSHDVYGTGECGVMSLKTISCITPNDGGSEYQYEYISWGYNRRNISSIPNLDMVPIGDTSSGIPTGESDEGRIPGDRYKGSDIQCLYDTNSYYPNSTSSYNKIPSPYLTDGSRNPGYYQTTSPSSARNCLSDFDGKGNTQKIITQRGTKDYNSWKPTADLDTDYPAASCCDMFYTEGTSQGDWYLPAMGELGYIASRLYRINESINKIISEYGSSIGYIINTDNSYEYWASTEGAQSGNYTSANVMDLHTNECFSRSKGSGLSSRPFLRV